MGVEYSVLDKKGKLLVHVEDQACFSNLGYSNGLQDLLDQGMTDEDYDEDYDEYSAKAYDEDALANRAAQVVYHINPDQYLTHAELMRWLRFALNTLGLGKIIPRQSMKAILKNGLRVDGSKVSGVSMISLFSLIRYVEEESHIVKAYYKLRKLRGMDDITAALVAHEVGCIGPNSWTYNGGPHNTNHTVWVGRLNSDALTDAWQHRWISTHSNSVMWTKRRSYDGVHKFFTYKGNFNMYNNSTLKMYLTSAKHQTVTTKQLVRWLKDNVYNLRQQVLQSSQTTTVGE